MFDISIVENDSKGSFTAMSEGVLAGTMTFSRAGADKIIIDHTEVESAFAGKSVGKQLLLFAVDYARKNSIKILPLCPFAKSMFDKIDTIQDVLF